MLRKFIQPIDYRLVGIYLAELLGILGIILLVPLFFSLLFREFFYSWLLGVMSIGLFLIGSIGRKLQHTYRKKPALRDALIVTALIYLMYSLVAGIIFSFLPEHSYLDGVFEVMSGLTTTGLTMMTPETLPHTLVFFRSFSQWLGGLGIVIISLALLFRPGGAPLKLYTSEFGTENIIGSVVKTSRMVIKIYAVLTLAGFFAFMASGMNYYDALIHIMSGISTGGFSAHTESIGYFKNNAIYLTVAFFMFLGAVSFPLYYRITKEGIGQFFKDVQVKALSVIIILGTILFFLMFGVFLKNLVPAVFQTVTSITQTGFNTIDIASLSDKGKYITILMMIVGGSTCSTTGGIKLLRLVVLLSSLRWLVWKNALPEESKISLKVGGIEISPATLSIVMGFVTAYILILFFSTLALMYLEDQSFVNSLFEVASAEGTVGLSTGITSPLMNGWSKVLFIFNMWAGRLEIIPVLILLSPRTWMKRAKKRV